MNSLYSGNHKREEQRNLLNSWEKNMADAEKGLKRNLECLFCCVAVFLTAFYISASTMTGYVK